MDPSHYGQEVAFEDTIEVQVNIGVHKAAEQVYYLPIVRFTETIRR